MNLRSIVSEFTIAKQQQIVIFLFLLFATPYLGWHWRTELGIDPPNREPFQRIRFRHLSVDLRYRCGSLPWNVKDRVYGYEHVRHCADGRGLASSRIDRSDFAHAQLPFSYSLGLINLNSLGFNLILLPGVALGALAGHWLLKIVPQLLFERLLLASAALAALRLIWR